MKAVTKDAIKFKIHYYSLFRMGISWLILSAKFDAYSNEPIHKIPFQMNE